MRWTLCPTGSTRGSGESGCVDGHANARDIAAIRTLDLPRPGAWTLKLWLVDAAGNADPDSAATVEDILYDPTPPVISGFGPQDPGDPTRIDIPVRDDRSPIANAQIEIRRDGGEAWQPLSTQLGGGVAAARIDDEALPDGRYLLRASATNAAGLQVSTDRDPTGQPKAIDLPIRLASRIRAGRRTKRVCRQRAGSRVCRHQVRPTVDLRFGRPATLAGVLRAAGRPIPQQPLEVWQRIDMPGAGWERVATTTTGAQGRFRFKAPRGPARRLRFRYPGTAHLRGSNATVRLRVQAATTLAASRKRALNGEYVTFKGRLRGGWRPAAGLLVEMQVFSRGRWRTFAQPRADGSTGAWKYSYRFETVSGAARFRFRARVRKQSGYPFATGTSRPITVRVFGL